MYSIEQKDSQLIGSKPHVSYHLDFSQAGRHLVHITMRVTNTARSIVVCLPSWTPGSYKIREYAANLHSIKACTPNKETLHWKYLSKNKWEIQAAGSDVVITFVVYAHERSVRTSHVNRAHAFVMPGTMLPYVVGMEDTCHHVSIDVADSGWKHITTALSPVGATRKEEFPVFGALNYDILVDSPIEVGNHWVARFSECGAEHEIAVSGEVSIDKEWLVDQLRTIVVTEARMFGGVPYDRYVFFLQFYPGVRGGLEHARSSVNAWDPLALKDTASARSFLALLCHEYFHTWNVKRIRPIELGPFNYESENYTEMLWLAEGATSYYDDLIAYRCGFMSAEDYIKTLSAEHLGKLAGCPGRFEMSTADSSFLAWVKLYLSGPDSNNRFPSYYVKGGVIFLLVDMEILRRTDGAVRLDDVMVALWKMYKVRPEQGITADEFFDVLKAVTQLDLREQIEEWLHGTTELPYEAVFSSFGLEWAIVPQAKNDAIHMPPQPDTGAVLREENGRLLVASVSSGTPADKARLGVDDEILTVNGKRVKTIREWEEALRASGANREAAVEYTCDGLVFSTAVVPEQPVQWALTQSVRNEQQERLFSVWLTR